LTIESKAPIPLEFRPLIGNRIYGCDDCQLVCPWNRFAQYSEVNDFSARHQLDAPDLLTLFAWSEDEFLKKMEGSPIRRIGYERWQRNIAVALGNIEAQSMYAKTAVIKLKDKYTTSSEFVKEHIRWALKKLSH
jgi:epoxyqueuosine reductase